MAAYTKRVVQIPVGYRFTPTDIYKRLDVAHLTKVKSACRAELGSMFRGFGGLPLWGTLSCDKNGHATEGQIKRCLDNTLKKLWDYGKTKKRLRARNPKPNPDPDNSYVVIEGEEFCRHPYPGQAEDSPAKDWRIDLTRKLPRNLRDELKKKNQRFLAIFSFTVVWGTPIITP